MVINSYIDYMYGIVRSAIEREAPVLRGQGKLEQIDRFYNSSSSLILVLISMGSIIFHLCNLFNNNINTKHGLFTYAITNIFLSFNFYFPIFLKTRKEFKKN